jgi:hypothetical protein
MDNKKKKNQSFKRREATSSPRTPFVLSSLHSHGQLVRNRALDLPDHRVGFDERGSAGEEVQPVAGRRQNLLSCLHDPGGVRGNNRVLKRNN